MQDSLDSPRDHDRSFQPLARTPNTRPPSNLLRAERLPETDSIVFVAENSNVKRLRYTRRQKEKRGKLTCCQKMVPVYFRQ